MNEPSNPTDGREHERKDVLFPAELRVGTETFPCEIINVSFGGVDSAQLLIALTDVALSTGSACSSGNPEPSHVLTALGLPDARVRGAVRFGLGRSNTREEIDRVADQLIGWVRDAREGRAAGGGRPPRRLSRQ